MDEYPVKVYIYDLSKGLARSMSMAFLGKQLDGIWHTGIVVFDQEIFYGGMGIESCTPGCTIMGQPDSVVEVGRSQIPFEMLMDYMEELSKSSFRPESYHLLDHNCNTFSNELAHFLTGNNIPAHITSLPQEVMNTPFGAMIKPFVDAMSVSPDGGHQLFPSRPGATTAPSSLPPAATGLQSSVTGRQPGSPAKSTVSPPHTSTTPGSKGKKVDIVTFRDDKIVSEYKSARSELEKFLSAGDLRLLDEIHEFLSTPDCSWGLSRQHLNALGNSLRSRDLPEVPKCHVARLLQQAVTYEDNVPLITHDPSNTLLSVLVEFENQGTTVQTAIGRVVCNFGQHGQGMEWLQSVAVKSIEGHQRCVSSVITKLCASSLLSDDVELNATGAALAQNLTTSKMSEENAVEVGIALIQLLSKDLSELTASQSIGALSACMDTSNEVSEVAAVMGLNVDSYSTKYPKLREICSQVKQHMT